MKAMSFDFKSRRSMVSGRRGMVAAENPLAAQAGLEVLQRGGNAADAAIATAAMMNVVDPASTGIGGDCFALYFDAKTKQVTALNGSGRAPAAMNIDDLQAKGHTTMPARGALSVTVPGAVRGWHDLLQKHGTMTLKDVLGDAIYYAENGYPLTPVTQKLWVVFESILTNGAHTEEYLPGGNIPQAGQIVQLPGLARTLRAIAEGGPEAFYTGPVAEAIVSTLQTLGNPMTHDDLQQHTSTWGAAIATDYKGVTVYEHPPNGQGLAALLALNIARGWLLKGMAWDSPERIHLMVEAMRLGFADGTHYVADPHTNPAPLDFLLSAKYADERRALISTEQAMQPPTFGKPDNSSDTIYLTVVDGQGNACSFINSLAGAWGSGVVAKGTGVLLQNRGAGFRLEKDHPNALAGGKRPYHTIIPSLITRDGELFSSFGVMGGFMQPQGHFQMVAAMIDDDLNPQEALDRPRWCVSANTAGPTMTLLLEEGIPVKTMARLAELGHVVRPVSGVGRFIFGSGQIIVRDPHTGVLYGGSDPREDGTVAAY